MIWKYLASNNLLYNINEIDLNDRRERTHAYKIYNTKK